MPHSDQGRPRQDDAAETRRDFIEFYDREYSRVVGFLMRCGASPQGAEDAAQEAFLDAWTSTVLPGKWADIASPSGWIRTVALRRYHRPLASRQRTVALPATSLAEIAETTTNHSDLTLETLTVIQALNSLDIGLRVIMSFHLDGFSGPEIASYLGITPQKVRDQLKKARKVLAAYLAKTGIGEYTATMHANPEIAGE